MLTSSGVGWVGRPSCRAYLATYEETIDLARGAAEKEEELAHDAPPELIEAVMKVTR